MKKTKKIEANNWEINSKSVQTEAQTHSKKNLKIFQKKREQNKNNNNKNTNNKCNKHNRSNKS